VKHVVVASMAPKGLGGILFVIGGMIGAYLLVFPILGKRVFDVYVQGGLKLKDFDIVKEAGCAGKPVVKSYTVNVTSNTLKIQLYWAGKGTTGIPLRGSYCPLISVISVDPTEAKGKVLKDGNSNKTEVKEIITYL
nr:probable LRR receptor-like serine/threonine-protein kinase At1g07650 [Tanacetum cinerariifolium]